MAFVYAAAFSGEKFIMVRNRRRGWEMPGGAVEAGETPRQAVLREFREETGAELRIVSSAPLASGIVFFGTFDHDSVTIGKRSSEEISEVAFFDTLPEGLSFPREEYEAVLQEARSALKMDISG